MVVGLLALSPATADDPARAQNQQIADSDRLPFFGDPVTMTLTGSPSMVWPGETTSPQRIVTHPALSQVDPTVGVSAQGAGKFPTLPSRRPPSDLGLT